MDKEIFVSVICLVVATIMAYDDDNSEMMMACLALTLNRDRIFKIEIFFENNVPNMTPRMFRRFFRMERETLEDFIEFITPNPRIQTLLSNKKISMRKKVYMTVAYIGSKMPTNQLAYMFGVSEECLLRNTEIVMDAFIDNMDQIISWPTKEELPHIARKFSNNGRYIPNVIGCIDGLHLAIELTEERPNKDSYYNFKQWFSIHLQGTVTYDLRFINVFAGWPGKAPDSSVFRKNPLSKMLKKLLDVGRRHIIDKFHILGDKAYPLMTELLTPYRKSRRRRLDAKQRIYNIHLASVRQTVERAFGLLLRRFPRLQLLNQKTLLKKIKVVLAACILHNICIMEKDNIDLYLRKVQLRPRRIRRQIFNTNGFTTANMNQGNLKRELVKENIARFMGIQ